MGDQMSALWAQAPAVTRCVAVLPLCLHFASMAFPSELEMAMGLSLASVRYGRVWTVFTSVMYEPAGSLLGTLFALLIAFWVMSGLPALEHTMGSGRLLAWGAAASLAVNISFLFLASSLHLLWTSLGWASIWPLVPCHGLMPVAIVLLAARCFAAPDADTSFFGVRLKNKHYPFVLVGAFGLLSGPAVLQDVAALCVGYFHERPLGLKTALLSEATIQRWECGRRSCIFGRNLMSGRWISVRESLGDHGGTGLPTTSNEVGYTVLGRGSAHPAQGGTSRPQFVVFGGQGQRLGGRG